MFNIVHSRKVLVATLNFMFLQSLKELSAKLDLSLTLCLSVRDILSLNRNKLWLPCLRGLGMIERCFMAIIFIKKWCKNHQN